MGRTSGTGRPGLIESRSAPTGIEAVPGVAIALSKGRILDETLPLLARAGIVPAEDPETSRKLVLGTNRPGVSLVILRAQDVPTYVEYGAADLGVAGRDVLLEHGSEGLYQPLDLGIGRPSFLPTPAFPLRLAMGEMATLALEGQRAVPAVALAAGYEFVHPELEAALRAIYP